MKKELKWWSKATSLLFSKGKYLKYPAGLAAVVAAYQVLTSAERAEMIDNLEVSAPQQQEIRKALEELLEEPFKPNMFCLNQNASTIAGYLRRLPSITTRREMISTDSQGAQIALDWMEYDEALSPAPWGPCTPILLLIHGLNGHSNETYIRYMMLLAHRQGWRAVGFNHRGCGETRLYTPKPYNGACTLDLRAACAHIRRRVPGAPVYAAGFSLGANLLVKYLGEEGAAAPLAGAAAVSSPWNFSKNGSVTHGTTLTALGYSLALTHELKSHVRRHRPALEGAHPGIDVDDVLSTATLREFDERFTVPLGGFRDVADYHEQSRSCDYLGAVRVPLLCLNAEDDPVVAAGALPRGKFAAHPTGQAVLVTTRRGGHIGWGQAGGSPLAGASWGERLVMGYLEAVHRAGAGAAAAAAAPTATAVGGGGAGGGSVRLPARL